MKFDLVKCIEILKRTPSVLESLLGGLSDEWIAGNEGENTWNPYDVVGHLIFGEKTDWIVRAKIILSNSEDKSFTSFDRFAQFQEDQSRPIIDLINEFRALREKNVDDLVSFNLTEEDLSRRGVHPEFGSVTLKELLATWTVHDLGHIGQISRAMAKQYTNEVGPWSNYLGVLRK